ncbi:hypothetical protein NP233_g4286 [Leucocoprinus birnbaumii]|uniref:Uncharacterized protein n=1 Tax=Leucocoprinus birnbaumii TaxID=56174 RepID=A0AAD5VXI3_9AGAR|nr:hypothetical protein NP233_g4286 [Leucocoprinus birnbaumii]
MRTRRSAGIKNVKDRIKSTETQIERLSQQRTALLEQLNNIQSPIFSDLPTETLTEIFSHYVDSSRHRLAPNKSLLLLGANSHSLSLKVTLYDDPEDEGWMEMLRKPKPKWNKWESDLHRLLEATLVENGERLNSLNLSLRDSDLCSIIAEHLAFARASFPSLEELELTTASPNLGKLQLVYQSGDLEPLLSKFSWEQITALQLHGMHPHTVLELLTHYPRLVNFEFGVSLIPDMFPADFYITSPIVLPNLETFKWETTPTPFDLPRVDDVNPNRFILTHLCAPALRELSWGGLLYSLKFNARHLFVASLRATLTKLTISLSCQNLDSIFSICANVVELYLSANRPKSEALELLTVTSNKGPNLLHNLRALYLRFSYPCESRPRIPPHKNHPSTIFAAKWSNRDL